MTIVSELNAYNFLLNFARIIYENNSASMYFGIINQNALKDYHSSVFMVLSKCSI